MGGGEKEMLSIDSALFAEAVAVLSLELYETLVHF